MPTPRRRPAARPPIIDPGIVAFLAARAKGRIMDDRARGAIPALRRFSGLHRHVDANAYLLTSAGNFDRALERFAERRGGDDGYVNVLNDNLNAAIEHVDAWMRSGALAAVPRARAPRA